MNMNLILIIILSTLLKFLLFVKIIINF